MTTDLATLVLANLTRAQRIIRKLDGDPIDPQFRIATPDVDYWIAMTLDNDPQHAPGRWV